jgi:hypothetical protein
MPLSSPSSLWAQMPCTTPIQAPVERYGQYPLRKADFETDPCVNDDLKRVDRPAGNRVNVARRLSTRRRAGADELLRPWRSDNGSLYGGTRVALRPSTGPQRGLVTAVSWVQRPPSSAVTVPRVSYAERRAETAAFRRRRTPEQAAR